MIQVFGGHGYVGNNYVMQNPTCKVNNKYDYEVVNSTSEIVYFISTVSNYNVKVDPYVDINTNLITLMKVLEQCKGKDLIFNFISSWFVYGDTNCPASEDSYCNPKGFYSITKRCAEQLLVSYCETFNIRYRILRLANVVGGTDYKASAQKNALHYMISELKENRNVNLYDNGNLYRDYIHNDDVARAINIVMSKGSINTVYNIGNGVPYLFKDIIFYAKELIGGTGQIIPIDVPKFHQTVQVHSMWMNTDKLKDLGYRPKFEMKDMIKDVVHGR